MKAIEILEKYVMKRERDTVGVIAIETDKDNDSFWWHVHRDEELPTGDNIEIAIHIEPRTLKLRHIKKALDSQ